MNIGQVIDIDVKLLSLHGDSALRGMTTLFRVCRLANL